MSRYKNKFHKIPGNFIINKQIKDICSIKTKPHNPKNFLHSYPYLSFIRIINNKIISLCFNPRMNRSYIYKYTITHFAQIICFNQYFPFLSSIPLAEEDGKWHVGRVIFEHSYNHAANTRLNNAPSYRIRRARFPYLFTYPVYVSHSSMNRHLLKSDACWGDT